MAIFGLAGIAEAGIAFEQGLLCIGVYSAIIFACLGLFFRSVIPTVVSAVLAILTTIAFLPWRAFWPEPSDDRDVQSWQSGFRFYAWWWIVACIGAFTACADAFQRRRRRSE